MMITGFEISDRKRQLRVEVRSRKKAMDEGAKQKASRLLCGALLADEDLKALPTVVAYWPMADEIDVRPFVLAAVERGQKVFLPQMVGDDLVFRQFTGVECLRADSRYGIGEPQGTPELVSERGEGVGIITPGVAFTIEGERLGRGRGFYDRAFSLLPDALRIGVAYECQMFDELPTETHDVRMDRVLFA